MGEPTDHDLLIRIDERVQEIKDCLTRHLAHHWTVLLAFLGALLAVLTSLAVAFGTH